LKQERGVRDVETSIFLVVAFETSERAAKVYEMFRDAIGDEMRQVCDSDPELSKAAPRRVFFEMAKRWLDCDYKQALEQLLRVAKMCAFLELTAVGDDVMGVTSRKMYEAAGKAAWGFYLAQRDKQTEG
jgi:hypothetical protein